MISTDYTEGSGKARTTREATIVQHIGHVHVLAKLLLQLLACHPSSLTTIWSAPAQSD